MFIDITEHSSVFVPESNTTGQIAGCDTSVNWLDSFCLHPSGKQKEINKQENKHCPLNALTTVLLREA